MAIGSAPALVQTKGHADDTETPPPQQPDQVLDQLKSANANHLLEPRRQLGNDEVGWKWS